MSLPLGMTWEIEPAAWHGDNDVVTVTAGPATDYFLDPGGDHRAVNAPRAMVLPPSGSWQLRAHVRVDFDGTYDAGVLMIYQDDEHWAKLCFERSPKAEPMVVSVVTNGRSDDANAWVVSGNEIWLRVSTFGDAFAFHASTDGQSWEFVRYFRLTGSNLPRAGIEVQAPLGNGCTATFSSLSLAGTALADLRDGS